VRSAPGRSFFPDFARKRTFLCFDIAFQTGEGDVAHIPEERHIYTQPRFFMFEAETINGLNTPFAMETDVLIMPT
jgi:hypothetical protein